MISADSAARLLGVGGIPRMAEELAWLGYDLMGTANNHSTDYGVEGVRSTIANLEAISTSLRSDARKVWEEYLKLDSTSTRAQEVRRHLETYEKPKSTSQKPKNTSQLANIQAPFKPEKR